VQGPFSTRSPRPYYVNPYSASGSNPNEFRPPYSTHSDFNP